MVELRAVDTIVG